MVSWSARYFQALHRKIPPQRIRDTGDLMIGTTWSNGKFLNGWNVRLLQLIEWKKKHIRSIISICPNASQRPPYLQNEKNGELLNRTNAQSSPTSLSLVTANARKGCTNLTLTANLNHLDRQTHRKDEDFALETTLNVQSSEDYWCYSPPNCRATTLHDYDRLDSVAIFHSQVAGLHTQKSFSSSLLLFSDEYRTPYAIEL